MELFDDYRYATGFVKPKTTSILFDKILVTDDLLDENASQLGYAYIPNEVLLTESHLDELFSPKARKSKKKFSAMHELTHFVMDMALAPFAMRGIKRDMSNSINKLRYIPHVMRNEPYIISEDRWRISSEDLKALNELDYDVKVEYMYSSNRNNGITKIIDYYSVLGVYLVPVFFSPTEHEKQFNQHSNELTKRPAISICINNFPEMVEEHLDWEQVLNIRNDKKSIIKVRRLKNWLNKEILCKSDSEMKSILDEAIDDYKFALKKHGIQTIAGAISTVSTASVTLLNTLSQSGSFDVAGLSIASGLSVFAIKSFVDRMEAKRHPVALIYDLMK